MIENYKRIIKELPLSPGVYFYKDAKGKILYIGKASVLRTRVSSYFLSSQDNKTAQMLKRADTIAWEVTDSVLEALILEANLIKKYKPQYNLAQKDDKTFARIYITREDFPRVLVDRPTSLKKYKIKKEFGPYLSAKQARDALEVIRKIFPYHDHKSLERPCFHFQIGLCPGPCAKAVSQKDYLKNIKNITLFLEGKKKRIIKILEKEMAENARYKKFERAAEMRDKIFALKHLEDSALIYRKEVLSLKGRIEAYDISNISGKFAVGSMVVFEDGVNKKEEYRRFKIKNVEGINDVAMLQEILERRLKHTEWKWPDLILLDGGKGQFNAIKKILKKNNSEVFLASVAKGPDRKGSELFKNSKKIIIPANLAKMITNEAHRFAIGYHRKLREKEIK
jgi:excinuclease ABC subunit C